MRWITNPIKEGSRKVEKENLGEREWNNPPQRCNLLNKLEFLLASSFYSLRQSQIILLLFIGKKQKS